MLIILLTLSASRFVSQSFTPPFPPRSSPSGVARLASRNERGVKGEETRLSHE